MTEAKIIAGLAALIAILGMAGFGLKKAYDDGRKNGMASIQVQWDQDKAAIQKAADAQIAAQTRAKEDALAANEVISNDYEAQLLAARAMSTSLAVQLRNYTASHPANPSSVPKAGDRPYPTDASSQASDVRLTNALGSALAECSANTAQLDALIVEIKRQL